MTRSKVLPLYAQISGKIAAEIQAGRFKAGQKIYSIREICEQFNVADITAKRALQDLGQRGLIRTVTGSGAFVTDVPAEQSPAKPVPRQVVGFLKLGQAPAPIFVHEIELIQQALTRLDLPMLHMITPDEVDSSSAAERLIEFGAGCLLVFPQHKGDFEQNPVLGKLRRSPVPFLVLETRMAKDSYICTDTERATRELADYLYDQGHRRICLATAYHRKVTGLETAVKRWNDSSVKTWVIGESGKDEINMHRLAGQIMALTPRPTAVICSDDSAASVIVGHFMAHGIRVPEDISVATYGDHPTLSQGSPVPVTVVRHPAAEVAQEVASWCKDTLAGIRPTRRLRREITGTLIARDSTAPPSGAPGGA